MSNKIKWQDESQEENEQVIYVDENGNEVSPDAEFDALEEVIQESRPTPPQRPQRQVQRKAQSEALRRIQKAKLYEVLITHDLIGSGSADEEIITEVQEEIQQFFSARLDFLLGLSADGQPSIVPQIKLPFTEEQVGALSAMADRIIQKTAIEKQAVSKPTVKPLQTEQFKPRKETSDVQDAMRYAATPLRKVQPVVNKVVKAAPQPVANVIKKVVKVRPKVRARAGQAVDKSRPPKSMPTQAEWDMMNARNVQQNQQGAGSLVSKAIGTALSQNQSIVEDLGPDK